jgi:hypothetical protein
MGGRARACQSRPMTKTITILALSAALVAALAPAAAAGPPPVAGGASCTLLGVQKTYRLGALLRRGLPAKVSCTLPATVLIGADFEGSRWGNWIAERWNEGHPGVAMVAEPRRVPAGVTVLRAKLRPWARRGARRLAPLPISIGLGIERTDGEIWNDAKSWWRSRLVR